MPHHSIWRLHTFEMQQHKSSLILVQHALCMLCNEILILCKIHATETCFCCIQSCCKTWQTSMASALTS